MGKPYKHTHSTRKLTDFGGPLVTLCVHAIEVRRLDLRAFRVAREGTAFILSGGTQQLRTKLLTNR